MATVKVAVSVVWADFAQLQREIRRLEKAGADILHVDVMDGHLVPCITVGPLFVKTLRKITSLPLEVHLYATNPEKQIASFVESGCDILSFQVEGCKDPQRIVDYARKLRVKVGVGLLHRTPLHVVERVMDSIDTLILVTRSIQPDFGGSFIPEVLANVSRVRHMVQERALALDIEADGGMNYTTATHAVKSGATVIVVGSALFGRGSYGRIIRAFRSIETGSTTRVR